MKTRARRQKLRARVTPEAERPASPCLPRRARKRRTLGKVRNTGQTELVSSDDGTAAQALLAGRYDLVSPGVVRVPGNLGFKQGLSVHDPDGHVLNLIER